MISKSLSNLYFIYEEITETGKQTGKNFAITLLFSQLEISIMKL